MVFTQTYGPLFTDINPYTDAAIQANCIALCGFLGLDAGNFITLGINASLTDLELDLYTGAGGYWNAPTWVKFRRQVMLMMVSGDFVNSISQPPPLLPPVLTSPPLFATPLTNFIIYTDQVDGNLKAMSSTGTITILAAP